MNGPQRLRTSEDKFDPTDHDAPEDVLYWRLQARINRRLACHFGQPVEIQIEPRQWPYQIRTSASHD